MTKLPPGFRQLTNAEIDRCLAYDRLADVCINELIAERIEEFKKTLTEVVQADPCQFYWVIAGLVNQGESKRRTWIFPPEEL